MTVSEHGEYGPTLSWAQPKAKAKPKTKAGEAEPPKPPKPPKKTTAQPPDDSDRLKRLMSVPAEKWHKTLQYEGGDVTGIPGEFRYPGHGDGRVFIPAVSVRDAPSEHEVLTALRLAEEGMDEEPRRGNESAGLGVQSAHRARQEHRRFADEASGETD